MKRNILVLVIVFISILHEIALGYDDRIAHPKITENAVKDSVLKTYLSLYLGPEFSKDYESRINGISVKQWIMDGSTAEDADACQRANHMHNPMDDIPWSSSYMSDDPWWTSVCYFAWYQRYSNVTWATSFLAPAPDGQKASYLSPPPQNWNVARSYYYLALTSDLYRTLYFTKTFKTLGQVLHLLQDMAVPAHTRNDFTGHLVSGGEPYESYVQSNSELIPASAPDRPIFDITTLTKFWDTNTYNGTNPSDQSDIGLAEFTNANYFSTSTIRNNGFENGLTPEHYFPYPYIQYSSSVGPSYRICAGMTASGHEVQYISRKPCPSPTDTAAIDHFAVMTLMNADTTDNVPTRLLFWLDDNVYKQYAKELLPRAVGYSAALLDYFFRGQLGVTLVPGGLKVKNLSEETMSSGTIGVYYDDINNVRRPLQTYNMTNPLASGQATPVISFNTPIDNIKISRYIVVFKGKLGNEEDAVVGYVYTPTVYYFATVDGINKIMKTDTAGSTPSVVFDTNDPNLFFGRISPSPDGETLVYVIYSPQDSYNGRIYKLDLATGNTTFLTTGNEPDVSPDGEKIVFSRELGDMGYYAHEPIFTLNLVTNAETPLTNAAYAKHLYPVWSPDGSRIAYSRFNPGGGCSNDYAINVMNSAGTGDSIITCKTDGFYEDLEPAWSPDGNEIAFVRKKSGKPYFKLYKVNVATKYEVSLTDSDWTNFDELSPSWSPDGMTIAVGSSRYGNFDLCIVDAFGAGYLMNLTYANGASDGYPIFGK